MVSACLCQATVRRTGLPCLRKTKTGSDFCGYHQNNNQPTENNCSEDCTICMCPIQKNSMIITPCKHTFHKTCLNQWTQRGKNSCPNCRGPVGSSSMDNDLVEIRDLFYNYYFNHVNHEETPIQFYLYNTLTGVLIEV